MKEHEACVKLVNKNTAEFQIEPNLMQISSALLALFNWSISIWILISSLAFFAEGPSVMVRLRESFAWIVERSSEPIENSLNKNGHQLVHSKNGALSYLFVNFNSENHNIRGDCWLLISIWPDFSAFNTSAQLILKQMEDTWHNSLPLFPIVGIGTRRAFLSTIGMMKRHLNNAVFGQLSLQGSKHST
jgi:hypothetical protein